MANFALEGPKWGSSGTPGGSGGQVTWSFASLQIPASTYNFDRAITEQDSQSAIRQAFARWESVCNIDFVESTDAASIDIRLGWDAIDGAYNTVGECSYSYSNNNTMNSGEIRFDTAETWTIAYMFEVALHEIGHAIGFDHYDDAASIMNAYADTPDLTAGDIEGAVYVYGAAISNGTVFARGAGDDNYAVSNVNDVVNEAANQGFDTVLSSVSYALKAGQSIERLATSSPATLTPLNLTGNDLAQRIEGNAGANILDGKGGNDVLFGNGGNDTLTGGTGVDTMSGGAGNDIYGVDNSGDVVDESLAGSNGNDTVQTTVSVNLTLSNMKGAIENVQLLGTAGIFAVGNALGNVLTGNAGANSLTGGAGNDLMRGLGGNDSYGVDSAGDVVDESATGSSGIDTVISSVDLSLAWSNIKGAVENLTLAGSALNGVGNALANVLNGNAGANILNGLAGNDTLNGGGGNDRLNGGIGIDFQTGGAGTDLFVFASTGESGPTAGTADQILDFATGDRISVSGIDANGLLAGDQAFVLDTNGSFSIGEIRQTIVGSYLRLDFNTDNDSAVEMALVLVNHGTVGSGDFVL